MNGVKKYIIIPCIISIFGHSLFFAAFKTDIKSKLPCPNPQLFLITEEQLDYIGSVAKRVKDVIISPFPKSLSSKNTIWKDALDIVKDTEVMKLYVEPKEDAELLEDSKRYNFEEIIIPSSYYPEFNQGVLEEFVPIFSDLFPAGLLVQKVYQDGGYILKLNNGINMRYYVQGPIQSRGLVIRDTPVVGFNMDKSEIKAKFRLWVTKDGGVNQVIIEESSSFPLVDLEIVDLIKTWRFSPIYDSSRTTGGPVCEECASKSQSVTPRSHPDGHRGEAVVRSSPAPNYEWGIVKVRLQR